MDPVKLQFQDLGRTTFQNRISVRGAGQGSVALPRAQNTAPRKLGCCWVAWAHTQYVYATHRRVLTLMSGTGSRYSRLLAAPIRHPSPSRLASAPLHPTLVLCPSNLGSFFAAEAGASSFPVHVERWSVHKTKDVNERHICTHAMQVCGGLNSSSVAGAKSGSGRNFVTKTRHSRPD